MSFNLSFKLTSSIGSCNTFVIQFTSSCKTKILEREEKGGGKEREGGDTVGKGGMKQASLTMKEAKEKLGITLLMSS
jgi:hypothetical protein